MKRFAWALPLIFSSCMRLDTSLYVPDKVDANQNLMELAKDIPANLVEEIKGKITSDEGNIDINAYLLKHDAADGTPVKRHGHAILYCHGQTGHIGRFAVRVQELWRLGFNVLVFDYQGYGKNEGKPSENAVLADTRAARAYLESRNDLNLNADKVAMYGWSLGTAICGQVATERPPKALVLETPFTSTAGIVEEAIGLDVPGSWFLDSKMDLIGKIARHTGSLLVFGGTKDKTTPLKFAGQIKDAATAANPSELVIVEGADHVTVPCVEKENGDRDNYTCGGGFTVDYKSKVASVLDAAFGI